jgi:ribosome maturation factor RimP
MEEFVVELNPEAEMLRKIIEPLLDSEGYELVNIMIKNAQSRLLLALFIDTRDKKNGIVLENLEDISRLLSDVLDVSLKDNNILSGPYDLEISSPGLDRPLTKLSHFKDALGEEIKIRLKNPDDSGARNIFGYLLEALDDSLVLKPKNTKDERVSFKYKDLNFANIIFDFMTIDKHKKKSVKK